VACIVHGIASGRHGIYNVAGDGALTIHEIAARMGKRCRVLPAGLLRAALAVLKTFSLTPYGPEQLDFLRYRPVLSNRRLKKDFGFVPAKTSAEAFDFWWAARQRRSD
jgi:UDP-glucose 4-epimerase